MKILNSINFICANVDNTTKYQLNWTWLENGELHTNGWECDVTSAIQVKDMFVLFEAFANEHKTLYIEDEHSIPMIKE